MSDSIISQIENLIASQDLNAAQVFTQMRQLILTDADINKIKADALREATNDILGYAGLTDYYNQFIERANKLEEGGL